MPYAKIKIVVDAKGEVTANVKTNAEAHELKSWLKYIFENLDKAEEVPLIS